MKGSINIRLVLSLCLGIFGATHTSILSADDTEVFFSNASSVVKPNIMFVIDNSGSMRNSVQGTSDSRMEVVQSVTNDLIDSMENVNVGLAKFNIVCRYNYCRTESGGHILSAPVAVESNRSDLKALVDGLEPVGNTPLAETLAEVARYFRGESPLYDGAPISSVTTSNGQYVSPVKYQCQKNFVVFLTDGAPTADDTDDKISAYIGKKCGDELSGDSNCLDEVAEFLATKDISASLDDAQNVFTSTVGFATQQSLLENTARLGKGTYYQADDAASLKKAFASFYEDVLARGSTFAAPGVAVNTFDRLNHLDTLYYSLFQPKKGAIWDGNLKRYKLDVRKDNNGDPEVVIVDVNDNPAIDKTTGLFSDSARSWWSPVIDGRVVSLGGAASKLPDTNSNRKVFSNLNSSRALSDSANQVVPTNTAITADLLGDASMDAATREKIINWTRGLDVNDQDGDNDTSDARKLMADPLHSVPYLAIYDPTSTPQDVTIFYGDNQGYLHAIDGSTGSSIFAFMPKELLANQATIMNGTAATEKVYGMDGSVVSWVHDDNRDGVISAGGKDKFYIYSGMRRGGRSYYALDVTNRNNPELVWSISGGSGAFGELGQTWSTPVKTKVNIGGKLYEALIFAGGYDPDQDTAGVRQADDIGRAVYIVDAETGDLLWWAGGSSSTANLKLPEMQYSIPASPKVLDVNGDGLADQIYVGDVGGQIFRFDLVNTNKLADFATGGRIADLGGATAVESRRFYHSPDLFGLKIAGKRHLGLIIGSGYHAHPLDKTIDDRIYMLKIDAVSSAPVDPADATESRVLYQTITESDLYDATANLIQQGTEGERQAASTALSAADGWFIRLERDGEKVMASSTTVNNEVYVTTYEPKASSDPCVPPTGTARMYHLSVLDGSAVRNYDEVGPADELTQEDREVELKDPIPPAKPQRIRLKDTDIICVGTDCRPIPPVHGLVETFWYED
ncbi:PilC/PilY family type IV pilus protein [Marinobacter daepoensis]|uniref:PilC/PilY family type IV pilus protein n=1 Tax=Marinobacter daepoensis TaxID=262077 RepID=UPI0003F66609|nr:PilC/PilY family type IV pilus protein [Marinobacter daepoensis]